MASEIPDGISKQDIIRAIRDLESGIPHEFGESRLHDVLYEGKRYPPKAVIGLAARRLLGHPLTPDDFHSGETSKCHRLLKGHGFVIKPKLTGGQPSEEDIDWTTKELTAAIKAYLEMRTLELRKQPYNKAATNRRLRDGALSKRSQGSIEYRMQNISAVLAEYGGRGISGYKPAANVGKNTKKRILSLLEKLNAFGEPAETPTDNATDLENRTRRILSAGIAQRPIGKTKPEKKETTVTSHVRDPAVKAYVLQRANGRCELCGSDAPFLTMDEMPYLEVHHITPLSQRGADVPENAAALCPTCHRRCHYAKDRTKAAGALKKRIDTLESG